MKPTLIDIAVIGAGPVGLALALHASRVLPHARVSLFDSRAADQDVGGDPRTLALSLGSVQLLQRLGVWPADAAQPIREVHVSQLPPTLPSAGPWAEPEVRIRADEEGVPMLGAVLRYGQLVAPLQQAWLQAVQQRAAAPGQPLRHAGGGAEAAAPTAWSWTPASPSASTSAWWPKAACSRSRRARRWPATTARRPGSARPRCRAARRAWRSNASRGTARWRCCRCATPRQRPASAAPRWCGACPATTTRCATLDAAQRQAVLNTLLPEPAGAHHRAVAAEGLRARPECRAHAGRRPQRAHRQCRADAAPGGRPGPEPGPARCLRAGAGAAPRRATSMPRCAAWNGRAQPTAGA